MHKRLLTATALVASALVITACGNAGNDSASSTGNSSTSTETAKGNDVDIAFLTGMTPHHEQAVEMSEMVLATNPPAAVAAIANRIKDAQAPEIERMEAMLAALGETPAEGAHSGGHSAGMAGHGGMMSDAEMAALMDATGTDAARLYLEGMFKHHQGAIEASDTEIADGQYPPAIELARAIKAAQTAEIAEMRALLDNL